MGTAVSSLSEAKAGDVICYSGHVAIYDGNGGIVEAKGTKWGTPMTEVQIARQSLRFVASPDKNIVFELLL